MARVFLSHSSRDNISAGRMKAWLEQQGFEAPFLDFAKDSGIAPGADWEKTLYREIERSQAMLIILSANQSASKWCDREFILARSLGKQIFQVIETADGNPERPERPAPELQVIDLRQEREAGLEQLKTQLAEIALTAQGGFPWDGKRPPYPGLPSFKEEDAAIYFGRDDDIRHLRERLTARRTLGGARLLVLLGASGSGKSSLLRAGVLPRLGRSGQGWLVVPPFRPQSQPCQVLARALALAADRGADWRDLHRSLLEGDRLGTLPAVLQEIAGDLRMAAKLNEAQILLSIDQGEELFGAIEQEEVQRFFRILTAAMGDDLPFLAVMTLRSEFLGRLQAAEKDGLTARFEEVSLAPMAMAQIPDIIKRPAEVVGLEVEEAFVQQAATDAETEDALPLLAFALRELYDRFGGDRHLSLADYQALGDAKAALSPLENAVRRRADEVLIGMDPSEQQMKALRDAFLQEMVRVEQGNYVRQPARWDDLPPEAQPLLEQLVNARLLISREEEGHRLLEVAHEALLRKWPLLRGWLDDDREFLIGRQQLEQDLQDWQKADEQERPGALLSGLKLQRAKAWLAERPQQLKDEVRGFVQASIDQAETQEGKERRNRRRVLAGLSGLTALAVAGGSIAWWREGAARAAQVDQYAANHRALLTSNPLESVVNGLAATDYLRSKPGDAFELSHTLEQAVQNNQERDAIYASQEEVQDLVALIDKSGRPTGDVATAGSDGTLKRWGKDGKQIGPTIKTNQNLGGFRSYYLTLVALPDGELISSGEGNDTLKRWGKDGKQIGHEIPTGQKNVTSLVALIDKSGRPTGDVATADLDGTLKRWGKDGKQIGPTIKTRESVVRLVALPEEVLASASKPKSNDRLENLRNNVTLRIWGKDGRQVGATIYTKQKTLVCHVKLANGEIVSSGNYSLSERSSPTDPESTLKRWGKDGKQIGHEIATGQEEVTSLVALIGKDAKPNGELISGGKDGTLRRFSFNKQDGTLQRLSFNNFNKQYVMSDYAIKTNQGGATFLVAIPDGELVSTGSDGSLKRWHFGSVKAIDFSIVTDNLTDLVALPDGDLVSSHPSGYLKRWRWGKDSIPTSSNITNTKPANDLLAVLNGGLVSVVSSTPVDKLVDVPLMREVIENHNKQQAGEIIPQQPNQPNLSGGVGITTGLNKQTNELVVWALIDGAPASRAGVETQDVIVSIDGKSTKGMSTEEAVTLIRGKAGTTVKLTLRRKGNRPLLTLWSKNGNPIEKTYLKCANSVSNVARIASLPNGQLVSIGAGDMGFNVALQYWSKQGKCITDPIELDGPATDDFFLAPLSNVKLVIGTSSSLKWISLDKDGKNIHIDHQIATGQSMIRGLVALIDKNGRPTGDVVTSGKDGTLKRWGEDGLPVGSTIHQEGVRQLAVLPDGNVVGAMPDGTLKRWSLGVVTKRGCHDLQGHRVLRNPKTPAEMAASYTCRKIENKLNWWEHLLLLAQGRLD
jgi:hypothetical protein